MSTVYPGYPSGSVDEFVKLIWNTESVAAFTVIPPWVPVIVDVTVSVAVIDCVPTVLRVALKEPVPLVSVESAGRVAWPSLLVKCTVPEYPVAVLPKESLTVTVKEPLVPEVIGEGKPLTTKVLAAAGVTEMLVWL